MKSVTQVTPEGHANNWGQAMAPTILITRPDPAGSVFADQVRMTLGCGVPVLLSPMMRIEVTGPLPDLSAIKTLIFTSRNGVGAYLSLGGRLDIESYAVGDATATLAETAGLPTKSCHGDAGALVRQMKADRVAGPCLHIRGEHVTGEIVKYLNSAGIETREAVIYKQDAIPMSDAAKALLKRESPVILPLFSPRSARLFFAKLELTAPLLVACISEKVAACVPEGICKEVKVARRPDAEAVLEMLPELLAIAKQLEGGNRAQ